MAPPPLRTTSARVGHLSFEVEDIPRTEWFYDRFLGRLGFRQVAKDRLYLGYSNGEVTLWLIHETPARVKRRPTTGDEDVVADHVAWFVPSADDVKQIQDDLERHEIYPIFRTAEHPEFHSGYVSATWTDPSGVVLEVYTIPKRRSRKPRKGRRPSTPARGRTTRRR